MKLSWPWSLVVEGPKHVFYYQNWFGFMFFCIEMKLHASHQLELTTTQTCKNVFVSNIYFHLGFRLSVKKGSYLFYGLFCTYMRHRTGRVIADSGNRPLNRYVKLRVAHAPGMPGTFSRPPRVSDLDMHHDTCVTHVPWCMPGSPTRGFPLSRVKRSRHSRRMGNPQFYVSCLQDAHGLSPVGAKSQLPKSLCAGFY